ncbi:MAG: MFS transporter [Spirochaetales bacterium]|nr:MFS transporter [Spirochaetales bacterium]
MRDSLKKIYREDSPYKPYLLSLLVIGFSYGLQKGILDNYLAEIVAMTEFDRGVLEFFRELPGLMLVGILAVMYRFSAEKIYKIGALVALVGLMMLSIVPASRVLVTLSICIYSLGEHIQLGMKNSLGVYYAKPGKSGLSLGKQHSFYDMGTLGGFLIIIVLFRIISGNSTTFRIIFAISAALVLAGFVSSLRMTGTSQTDSSKRRFYFRKKFTKYYILEVTYGARKQVFFTFGPYLLVLHYGANASVMSMLFAISAICGTILSPYVGKLIDRIGYKTVMVSDTLLLVIVCFFYGFSEYFFPVNVSFVICCAMYVMDSIISLASMASNVYVQELSDGPEETRATIATGVSVNHFVTIFVALLGGWVWRATGIQTLFTISAVIGLLNSLFASTIKTKRKSLAQGS